MLDFLTENTISLREAARLFPRRPSTATIWRWVYSGVRGIRLESLVCGGRRYTSAEAVRRFLAATNGAISPGGAQSPKRNAAIRQAEDELASDGI